MEFMDFKKDFCEEFGYKWKFPHIQERKLFIMFQENASEFLTTALWLLYDDINIGSLVVWVAMWFDRKRVREVLEQDYKQLEMLMNDDR